MLRWRLISAAIILSIILSSFWLDVQIGKETWAGSPGMITSLLTLLIGLVAANEVVSFNPQANAGVKRWAVYCGTGLVICLACYPAFHPDYPPDCPIGRLGWPLLGMGGAVGLAFISKMIGYRPGDQVMDDVARTVLVVAYIGLLISFWAPIRSLVDNVWGLVALLSLYVTVKFSDTGAYAVGRTFGKTKLAPQLSPGKTVEGLIGGIGGGCLGAFFVFYLLAPQLTGQQTAATWWQILLFAVVVTIVGIVGDLCESLLKRDGGVKNSSRWLPGLGGVMDIIDSLLPAGPVVYAFWVTGWFGPVSS